MKTSLPVCAALAIIAMAIESVNATTITEYSVPVDGGGASEIISGPDGNLWFTDVGVSSTVLGRITRSGDMTLFPSPAGDVRNIGKLASGPDGNLWYTEMYDRGLYEDWKIAKMTPTGSVIAEYPISGRTDGIVSGPDGNLWFTEPRGRPVNDAIGRISPIGLLTEFILPEMDSQPEHIVAGSDGNLWFNLRYKGALGRITPSGTFKEFTISSTRDVLALTLGPDGSIWFGEAGSPSRIGCITPAGVITEFELSNLTHFADGITAGSDGNLWVYSTVWGDIDQVTPSGTELQLVHAREDVGAVINGPDRKLWLTEFSYNIIGTFAPDSIFSDPFETR